MAIKCFDHVAINARDIAKSRDFYNGLLGLSASRSVDMGECILHYLALPDGSAIELFEFKDRSAYDKITEQEGVMRHLAFRVDNIEEMNQKLKNAGVRFDMELCRLEPLGVKALLCRDPDGVVVELSQENR